MSRAISRESFNELKNYLGVYMQQGRVILDSDWNENQDIAVSFTRRMGREALGDGSPNRGFAIDPIFPILSRFRVSIDVDLAKYFGPLMFFLDFPGDRIDDFESVQGWALSSPQGKIRIARDRPYEGSGFLRVSGHAGMVTLTKTLADIRDLSAYDLATLRFRTNEQAPGIFKFFIEDAAGNRSMWEVNNWAFTKDFWLPGFAAPLDIRFRILTEKLNPAVINKDYEFNLFTYGGKTDMTWAITAGALPAGLNIGPLGLGDESRAGKISGKPNASGNFPFTVQVTDADGKPAPPHALTLTVNDSGEVASQLPDPNEFLNDVSKASAPTGTPANLAQVNKYGFEIYQETTTPLVWDFDDLRGGSSSIQDAQGQNNFIIRGSEFLHFVNQLTLYTKRRAAEDGEEGVGSGDADELIQNLLQLAQPSIDNAGRLYVAGLLCVQVSDTLYSQQRDPNDPLLAPPAPGAVRKDTVYLDVWTEPVTYVEDPEIREVALGGPDTTTRMRVRHRVRVAQGGQVPLGNGIGEGTLATKGSYTAQANRLYVVEIDTPGNIGTATFRWSEDNASTIQRVIEPIPPGSTEVVVEDGSAFHPGEFILIRKEFGAEEHRISSVFGNAITLQSATGTQLAALPAASRVPNFTTFALSDRPRIERWNGFRVPITPDPDDPTVSTAILLNDGVRVHFGGHDLCRGEFWNFHTRYLAGDESSGLDPERRIEPLNFVRARGVVHYYAPLALITRDGSSEETNKIFVVEDRRMRLGNAGMVKAELQRFTESGTVSKHVGGVRLRRAARNSNHFVFWSGYLYLFSQEAVLSTVSIRAAFYNDMMTDPKTEPDRGWIEDRVITVPLEKVPIEVNIPLHFMLVNPPRPGRQPRLFPPSIPTSVQIFVEAGTTANVDLTEMTVTVLELKMA